MFLETPFFSASMWSSISPRTSTGRPMTVSAAAVVMPRAYRDISGSYTWLHTLDAGRLHGHIKRLHTATHTGRWAATGTHRAATHGYTHRTATGAHRATTRCHCYTWLHTSDAGRLQGHIERLQTATHTGRRAATGTYRAATHGYTHWTPGGYTGTSSGYTRLHTPDAGRLQGHIGQLHMATHTGRRAATRAHQAATHGYTHRTRAATGTYRAATHGYTHWTPGGYTGTSSGYTRLHTPDAGRLQGHIERLHTATHTGRWAATGTHRAATHGYTHRTATGAHRATTRCHCYTWLHTSDAGRLQGHIERLHTATHTGRRAATGTHRASTHGYTHRTLGGYRDISSDYTRLHTSDAGRLQGHIERLHTATHTGRWAATGTHRASTHGYTHRTLGGYRDTSSDYTLPLLHMATHIGRRAATRAHRATTHGYTHRTLGGYIDTSSDYTRLHTPDAGQLHGHIERLHTATHTGRREATRAHRAVHTATHTGRRAATRAHQAATHTATHTGRWAATWTHRAATHGYTHRTPGGYTGTSSGTHGYTHRTLGGYMDTSSVYTRLHTPDAGRLQGHIERLHTATHTGRRAATWVIPCQFNKFVDVFPRTPSDCFEIWYSCRTW